MRLPPDVLAVLIKIRDFAIVLGPALLAAITLKAALLSALRPSNQPGQRTSTPGWLEQVRYYLEAPSSSSDNLLAIFRSRPRLNEPASKPGTLWLEAGALSAAPAALLTALVLSPGLAVARVVAAAGQALLGWRLLSGPSSSPQSKMPPDNANKSVALNHRSDLTSSRPHQSPVLLAKPGGKTTTEPVAGYLTRFTRNWLAELNLHVERTFYNFLVAALLTIFIPLRLVESWFGPGQWFGPLLIPLLGLALAPAIGSETALVLALFVKGASTGSGVAALLAFPLITIPGLSHNWRRYGLKATLSFGFVVWGVAGGIGIALDLLGINANV